MQDSTHEPPADAGQPVPAADRAAKTPHAPKEDGLSNPKDGRGPLRRTDDQGATRPSH
jgi:hypothetical protein